MRLVDTSAWIEVLIGSPLATAITPRLPSPGEWLVPTIVQFELAKWLMRETGDETCDRVIAFTQTCVVAGLDTRTALFAAEVAARHTLAMADAVVYATALMWDADVVTCDRHFEGLPRVDYLPKQPLGT
ncbi:type II toxin-antitoxin system VapC family toxin [uncultured Rhodospira sp.]|uniref:type II toxin-antitoxin system VapC family toxin n=1 Tax=uncultured Rhodospira sp. TaxID=1936189 RepID=UPI0026024065|nr:type II toxin-antitoxin system VapC family toxin [uncultured Rhodospira sp.]